MSESPFGIDFSNEDNRELGSQICDLILDFSDEWNERFPDDPILGEEQASFYLVPVTDLYETSSKGRIAVKYRRKILSLLQRMDIPSDWPINKKFSAVVGSALNNMRKKRG